METEACLFNGCLKFYGCTDLYLQVHPFCATAPAFCWWHIAVDQAEAKNQNLNFSVDGHRAKFRGGLSFVIKLVKSGVTEQEKQSKGRCSMMKQASVIHSTCNYTYIMILYIDTVLYMPFTSHLNLHIDILHRLFKIPVNTKRCYPWTSRWGIICLINVTSIFLN